MINYENNVVLLILIMLFPASLNAQTLKKIDFGINVYLLESNIQQNIFSKKEEFESREFTFGIEAILSKEIWKNTRIELGLDYSYFQFPLIKNLDLIYGERDANDQFDLILRDNTPIAEFVSNTVVYWNDSFCFDGESSSGDKLTLYRSYFTRFQTLNFPIRFDYLLGKKPLKIYLNGGISPQIYLSKKLDRSPNKTRASIYPQHCSPRGGGYEPRFTIIHDSLRIEKYNLKDFSILTELGIGIAHKSKKSLFRIGVHYGGNTINFSKVEGKSFIRETIKLKFGLQSIRS